MVEGAPLLREYRLKKLIEGSNPSLSALSPHVRAAAPARRSRRAKPSSRIGGRHGDPARLHARVKLARL